jgi:hypothetical protein
MGYNDPNPGGGLSWLITPPIDTSTFDNAEFTFMQSLDFESNTVRYDGGNLKISTTGPGGPWTQLYGTPSYEGTAMFGFENPLAGEEVWGGRHYWELATFDLTSYTGNVVNIRWDAGVDNTASMDGGWALDDILMTTILRETKDITLNWTLSADDGGGSDDVAKYNIYRADNPLGPWDQTAFIGNTLPGIDTHLDPDKGDSDGTDWWYVIRAVDIAGNEEMNTNAIPEVPPNSYDIDLTGASADDWVFVSYPIEASGSPEAVLNDAGWGDGGTTWDLIQWYDSNEPANQWKTYSVDKPAALNNLVTVNNNQGFWLHLTGNVGDQMLTVSGGDYPTAPVNIQLYTGWNQVGYPSGTPRQADTTLPGAVSKIAINNDLLPYGIEDITDLSSVMMSESNAYWVYSSSDTTWIVDP